MYDFMLSNKLEWQRQKRRTAVLIHTNTYLFRTKQNRVGVWILLPSAAPFHRDIKSVSPPHTYKHILIRYSSGAGLDVNFPDPEVNSTFAVCALRFTHIMLNWLLRWHYLQCCCDLSHGTEPKLNFKRPDATLPLEKKKKKSTPELLLILTYFPSKVA